MILAVLILLFFAYSIGIFFVDDWFILACLAGFQFLLMVIGMLAGRVNFFKALRNLVYLSPIIFLTGLFNYFFTDLETAAMVATRVALMCHMTYVFASLIPILKFAQGLSTLFVLLRIFGVNHRDLGITVAVSITFIPIVLSQYHQIKQAINARGRRKNTFVITMQIFMYRILYRASILGQTLDAKGYE